MRLNLNEIIEISGSSLPFTCELETERLFTPSVLSYAKNPVAVGIIRNSAGVLTLDADIEVERSCICDRCSDEFVDKQTIPVTAMLAAELVDEENPDIFLLDGTWLDVSDVLETLLILDSDAKCLCSPDCAGLCGTCGANLNHGKCNCQTNKDPRLAVLAQLLDIEE